MHHFVDIFVTRDIQANAKKCRWAKAGSSTQRTHSGAGLHLKVHTETDMKHELAYTTAKLGEAPRNAKVMKVKVV